MTTSFPSAKPIILLLSPTLKCAPTNLGLFIISSGVCRGLGRWPAIRDQFSLMKSEHSGCDSAVSLSAKFRSGDLHAAEGRLYPSVITTYEFFVAKIFHFRPERRRIYFNGLFDELEGLAVGNRPPLRERSLKRRSKMKHKRRSNNVRS